MTYSIFVETISGYWPLSVEKWAQHVFEFNYKILENFKKVHMKKKTERLTC